MQLPEIRITFSDLLYEVSKRLAGDKLNTLASAQQCREWARAYREAWQPYELKILSGMCSAVNLEFYRPIIDAYLAPFFQQQSDPLIINFRNQPDEFVDMLTHELIHILLTDNTTYASNSHPDETKLLRLWEQAFGRQHDFATLVHIPVHALVQYVFIDVLGEPDRLKREREMVSKFNAAAYVESWDYVDKHGYQQVIEKLKNVYETLRDSVTANS